MELVTQPSPTEWFHEMEQDPCVCPGQVAVRYVKDCDACTAIYFRTGVALAERAGL